MYFKEKSVELKEILMNIYESLKLSNPPSLSEHFKDVEKHEKKISEIIFDKEKIIKFNNEYCVFSENNLEHIIKSIDEILKDKGYILLCCAMYLFIKKDISLSGLKPPKDGTVKSELALLPPLIANIIDFCNDAKIRGVNKEILSKTLSALDMYLNSNKNRTGSIGTSEYHLWLPRYGQGKIFRIGAFQFELFTFNDEKTLSVHIPSGTKLDVKENLINFRYALDFFNKHYNDYDVKGFLCASWLMNPHIEEIMGRKTNITRFGDMFDRFEIDDAYEGVYVSVFNCSKPDNLDDLCENTSLQKNIKKYLKDGNQFKDYGGFISLQKFNEMVKEYL